MYLLSIITIDYNNRLGLKRTFTSVFNQSFSQYEYIVIDGGSTDGSINCIKKHANKITHWISEKDNGIYDAMNKGILLAKGKYYIFSNSGDCFCNLNTLYTCMNYLSSYPKADILYVDICIVDVLKKIKKNCIRIPQNLI